MDFVRITVVVLYFGTLGTLSVYGFHRLFLLFLLLRHRRVALTSGHALGPGDPSRGIEPLPARSGEPGERRPAGRAAPFPGCSVSPVVTVQIPVYTECNVAPRLVEAVSRLEYPRDRLEIQVLDDST